MPDTGHSLEEGDFPGIGSGALLALLFILCLVPFLRRIASSVRKEHHEPEALIGGIVC